jgi:hypothetical protein
VVRRALGIFFHPEDGGYMFLRNVGWLSTDYTALYPERKELFITTAMETQILAHKYIS